MARAGWRVTVIERDVFPRQKVCGECIGAGGWELLDVLGVGADLRRRAGPELREVGWMSGAGLFTADMPECAAGGYRFGRAIGRDLLDAALLERARSLGATVLQPARLESIAGAPGHFECTYRVRGPGRRGGGQVLKTLTAAAVIDAHGSWDHGHRPDPAAGRRPRVPARGADLFGFKASFLGTGLREGLLPVLATRGAYGGMVVSDGGRTTVACCIRREVLAGIRAATPGCAAGASIERFLSLAFPQWGVMRAGAEREGPWLSVGPVAPGIRMRTRDPLFRVGNAAGEVHPLIGEGIAMALQSAVLLERELASFAPGALSADAQRIVQERYSAAWRRAVADRLRVSRLYAHVATHPFAAGCVQQVLRRWPALLTHSARWAGKARSTVGFVRQGHVMKTLEVLQGMLMKEFSLTADQVDPTVALTTLGIDSLDFVDFFFKIEDRFELKIKDDIPSTLATLNDVAGYIDSLLAARDSAAVTPDGAVRDID